MSIIENFKVRHGTTTITVFPWKHSSGEIHWRWRDREGKCHTRKSRKKASTDAFAMARLIHANAVDLTALPDSQQEAIQILLKNGITPALAREFVAWKSAAYPEKPVQVAVTEFLALKETNRGRSIQNVRTLRKHLAPLAIAFAGRSIASIATGELEAFLASNPANGNRTRRNIRGALVTFWRWCQSAGYLAEGKTAASRLGVPIVFRKIPETWSPAEIAILLDAVRPDYLPWLAAAAFGGFRADEINPLAGGDKSPLDWSDFHWDRDIVIVRPETDKNGHRRVVPILPALKAWLFPHHKPAGRLCDAPPPHKQGKTGQAETARLGALVGGWRKNALRHSWISYRAADVGIAQAASEAGNSEAEARRSYNDSKSPAESVEWFSLRPRELKRTRRVTR